MFRLMAALAVIGTACTSPRKHPRAVGAGHASTTAPSSGKTFGTLVSPCGPGNAKGATDQGVTDNSITIGYGDDRGYRPVPGLDHEMGDAVKAMIKWCNDQGGINGRLVVGNFYDAAVTQAASVMTQACAQVFMLVGEGWLLDGAAEPARVACNLVAVEGFSASGEFANGPIQFQGMPSPVDYSPASIEAQIKSLFPDMIAKTALVSSTLPSEALVKAKAVDAMRKFGYSFLNCDQTLNMAGELDFTPFAQGLKDCGAQIVYFTGDALPDLSGFFDVAVGIGYRPVVMTDSQNYTPAMTRWNTKGNGDNLYVRLAFVPFEEADKSKATQDYMSIVRADGGDLSLLGAQAASSFLLWATEAKACGSGLTRQCMVNNLAKVADWTGGGMHASTNPAKNLSPSCGMLVRLQGATFVQTLPANAATFDCSPSYLLANTGPDVTALALNANRIVSKYLSASTLQPQP